MNNYINEYIEQAAAYFPVLGKQEKQYLAKMSNSIEDFFGSSEPESLEDIVAEFKMPQNVAKDYISTLDTSSLVHRIYMRSFLRDCIITVLAIAIMTATVFGYRTALLNHARTKVENENYTPPVFQAEEIENDFSLYPLDEDTQNYKGS